MQAKYLEVGGRTYYAFEEPDFVGPIMSREALRPLPGLRISAMDRYIGRGPAAGGRDVWFAFILPLVCIYFDPFIFRYWDGSPGWMANQAMFVYLLGALSAMGFATWRLFGDRLSGVASAALAGVFYAAAAVSLFVGIVLLPLSILGTIIVIGLLGFTPLLSSLVMLRSARAAFSSASEKLEPNTAYYVAFLSLIASIAIPWVVNQNLSQPSPPTIVPY